MQHLKDLNPAQKEAVLQKEGPILILAGAGAGKTRTITHRIIHLIKEGVNPSSILAVTFTNKASKEMQERIEKMLTEDNQINFPTNNQNKPFIKTFHALGVHILRENSQKLNISRYFNIFDKNDSKKAVKESLIQNNFDLKLFEPAKILGVISRQKGNFLTHKDYAKKNNTEYFTKIVSRVWDDYEKILEKEKALDFDDLLLKTALLLKNDAEVRDHYQNLWKYIHIDEYQDTNRVQYEISKLLSQKNNNIVLEENYRSTKTILNAANDIIKKNKIRKEKNLFTNKEEGEKISVISNYTENNEAQEVAKRVKELLEKEVSPDEIAILYRANFQSRVLEEYFMLENIPYQVLGTKFFERKEIKDIMSFIRGSLNPESLIDMKRIINIPPRGIGPLTILKVFSNKQDELSTNVKMKVENFYKIIDKIKKTALEEKPSDTIKFILKETGLEEKLKNGTEEDKERLENIREFVTLATKYDYLPTPEGIEKLLEDAILATDQDEVDKNQQRKEKVKLMTVHSSKGLEFDYVFITGLEDKLFPSKRDFERQTENQKEEERRLFYVALTRARKKIFLSFSSVRTIFGSRQMNQPSEFISDISNNLIEEEIIETNNNEEKIIYLDF